MRSRLTLRRVTNQIHGSTVVSLVELGPVVKQVLFEGVDKILLGILTAALYRP
ncbi:MAG: hypothetical protein ABJA18_08340 [bacterium]